MLLNISERPKRSFSCFCTLQKDKKEVFHASEHFRKAKIKFFTLLHTAERQKRDFSCFCTLQKGQNEVLHASEHFRKAKMKFFMLLNVSERLKKEELPLAYNFLLRYSVKRRDVLASLGILFFEPKNRQIKTKIGQQQLPVNSPFHHIHLEIATLVVENVHCAN